MKRTIALLMTALLALSVVPGCGENETENQSENGGDGTGGDGEIGDGEGGDGEGGDGEGGDGEGGDGEGGDGEGDGSYDELSDTEMMDKLLTDAFCEAAFQCYDQNPFVAQLAMMAGRYGSEEECKANLGDELGMIDSSLEEAVAGGRLVVDRSYLQACKNDFREMLCSATLGADAPPSCLQLLQGQIPEGEPCLDEIECEGALNCVSSQDSEVCYGTCGTYENSGQDCDGAVCGDGEFCLYEWDEETFESSQSCAALYVENEECEWSGQCANGLVCSDAQGICVPFSVGELGEECIFGDSFCAPGTRCDFGEIDEEDPSLEGTCEALGEEGDHCLSEYDCVIGLDCVEGDELLGTCGVFVPRADGEFCDYAEECASGFCDWNTDTCETPELLANGEECGWDGECESGKCEFDEEEFTSYCVSSEDLICELPE